MSAAGSSLAQQLAERSDPDMAEFHFTEKYTFFG
jgi:hypothetical protein